MTASREANAAVLGTPCGAIEIRSIAVSDPGPGEALVRMEACGICHSDVLVASLQKLPSTPLVLGHEGIGRVEAIGEGVAGVSVGDRVGVTFLASTCGACDLCRSGRERFCAGQSNHGYTRNGVMSGLALVAAQHLVPVPDGLPPEQAAPLCCAGWTAFAALCESGLKPGQAVALFGIGGLGHLGLQYALHKGLQVAAADISQSRLELARRLGAHIVVASYDAGRTLLKQHGGVDAAIVFTPSPEAVREAFRSLRRGGRLILVGLSTEKSDLPVFETVLKGITIRGSYLGARGDLEEVLRLAAAGVGRPLVQAHSLAEAPALFDRLRSGQVVGRAVVVF